MKKCVLGEGSTGNYIFQDHLLSSDMMQTKDEFVSHIARTIADEMSVGTFQN
jgi:hypothetical protein